MKKILSILMIAAVGVLWTSCNNDDDSTAGTPGFQIVESDVDFTATGGTGHIKVSGTDYTIAVSPSDATWCTATKSSTLITVSVDPSNILESRTAAIKVTSGGRTYQVPVTQMGTVVIFPSDVEIARQPTGPTNVPITANTGYTVSIPAAYQSWLSYQTTAGGINLTATNNPDILPRTAQVVFTRSDGNTSSLLVTQDGLPDAAIFNLMLGDWTCTYRTTYTGALESRTVTMADKVKNKQLAVSNLLASYPTIAFTLLYKNKGKVAYTLSSAGLAPVNSVQKYFYGYICGSIPVSSGGSPISVYFYSNQSGVGYLTGSLKVNSSNQLEFKLVDNGTFYPTYAGVGRGILFYSLLVDDSASSSGRANEGTFMDMTFTKPM